MELWEGKTPADFGEDFRIEWQRYRENRLTFRIPEGENYLEVMARVKPFVEKIVREHKGQEILTVGHRGSNRMLMALLLDYPLEEAVRIDQANDCIYVIERNDSPKGFPACQRRKDGRVALSRAITPTAPSFRPRTETKR